MLRKLFGRSSGSIPVSPGLIEEEFVRQFPNAKIIAGTKHVPKNQLAFIGRSGSGEAPPVNVTGVAWPQNRNKPFKIVSFYTTHNEYKQLAERLRATLDRFQLPYDLTPVENRGAWEFNCALKARYIQDQWRRSDIPVVWVDADATIESNPVLFGSIDADFAIHKWKGWQFGSGTVYFGKSDLAKQLLDQWALRCDADPTTYDQVHLHSAWCDISSFAPLRTIWLPRSYLDIFDKPSRTEKGSVIRHWQASRLLKADGRTTGRSPARMTKDGKHNRAANLLWRTAEEGFWISEGTRHIKPKVGGDFPEGFDVRAALEPHIGARLLLEIGCGVGRIASLFDSQEYIGVDVNPEALRIARENLPGYDFRIHDDGFAYPDAPTVLFYTVLLHVSDEVLPGLLAQACSGRRQVVIAELMDQRWRRPQRVPVFNRNPDDYKQILRGLGFSLVGETKHAYERYNTPKFKEFDSRLTILGFSR